MHYTAGGSIVPGALGFPAIAGAVDGIKPVKLRIYIDEFAAYSFDVAGDGLVVHQYVGVIHQLLSCAYMPGMPDQ